MEFDLMYLILPGVALLVGAFLGRWSKHVKEDTYEHIFMRIRKENDILEKKLENAEHEIVMLRRGPNKVPVPVTNFDNTANLNWKIKQATGLTSKPITDL